MRNTIKTRKVHFRVDTPALLKEITDSGLKQECGVLAKPINIFRILLIQLAQRCAQVNDPVLNKIMFDLALYELPNPSSIEYSKLMNQLYKAAEKQLKKENQNQTT